MIVEDDPDELEALTALVRKAGLDVTPFSEFLSARQFLVEHIPDTLIVDVRLGEYNGLQLVLLAKSLAPKLNVIVISGYDDRVLQAQARSAGAVFIAKPVDFSELRPLLTG